MENVRTIKIQNGGSGVSNALTAEEMPVVANRKRRTYRKRPHSQPLVGGGVTVNQATVDNSQPSPVSEIGAPIINIIKDTNTPAIPLPQKGGSNSASSQKTNIPPGPVINAKEQTGAGTTKVVLKKKNRTSKVILKPKTGSTPLPTSGSPVKKTRRLVVKQVSKRLKKTRHVVKHAKEMPIDQLRKILITKKLIKPNSKAPESILRQIYADSVIVGKKTL